jgi:hypothetical protein
MRPARLGDEVRQHALDNLGSGAYDEISAGIARENPRQTMEPLVCVYRLLSKRKNRKRRSTWANSPTVRFKKLDSKDAFQLGKPPGQCWLRNMHTRSCSRHIACFAHSDERFQDSDIHDTLQVRMEFHEINAFNKWTENLHMTAGMENRVVGYSRLAGERTLTRLRALRSDLIDPTISLHQGRVVKHTGDGVPVEFRSEVEVVLWLGGSAVREYAAIR